MDIIKIDKLKLMHRYIYRNNFPKDITDSYNVFNNRNNYYQLRNDNEFPTYRFNTNLGKKHSYNNTVLWNNLTINTKLLKCEKKFIKQIKLDISN